MDSLPQQAVYVENPRLEVARFIPIAAQSAVDVGCARGGFGRSLRAALGPDARIIGIEPVSKQAAAARKLGVFDAVTEGYFPQAMPDGERVDLICFNDVLEHILDPWQALRDCHDRLTPGGYVLATIPSIQYAPILWQLIRGRWDYTDSGTLDRTHVRFFTRATMRELFESTGYEVLECVGVNGLGEIWDTDPLRARRLAKRVVARTLGDAQHLQFVLLARPAPVAG